MRIVADIPHSIFVPFLSCEFHLNSFYPHPHVVLPTPKVMLLRISKFLTVILPTFFQWPQELVEGSIIIIFFNSYKV